MDASNVMSGNMVRSGEMEQSRYVKARMDASQAETSVKNELTKQVSNLAVDASAATAIEASRNAARAEQPATYTNKGTAFGGATGGLQLAQAGSQAVQAPVAAQSAAPAAATSAPMAAVAGVNVEV